MVPLPPGNSGWIQGSRKQTIEQSTRAIDQGNRKRSGLGQTQTPSELVGRASLDLATLGLKVKPGAFHHSSALTNSARDLRRCSCR